MSVWRLHRWDLQDFESFRFFIKDKKAFVSSFVFEIKYCSCKNEDIN